jgi:hypothetical protein
MKSRYCYNPMTSKRIGQRLTIADRFRRWKREREERRNWPDVFMVTGYNPPIYPGK